jgi:diguanylate cyclase (GGDEF)-like protein/PAS domain S-box-containing protein
MVVGLLALIGLGWRLQRLRRSAIVDAQRRALENRSEQRVRALLEHSTDVVTVIGTDLRVRWQATSVRRMLGIDAAALTGRPIAELVHPDDVERFERALTTSANTSGSQTTEARFRHTEGGWRALEVIADNRLGDPAVAGVVLIMRDVTERKVFEEELRHRAFHDPLTGLANRALFEDRLSHAFAGAARLGRPIAVLFLDLDDFKPINDTLGHARGDDLLCAVAKRFTGVLRPGDTAARFGGDEFAILLELLETPGEARSVAERVLSKLSTPFSIRGHEVHVGACIGVAIGSQSSDADSLLRHADIAMYAAKETGKGSIRTFEPPMSGRASARIELTEQLRRAVDAGEFELDYQPFVELDSGRLLGIEALVRWRRPDQPRLLPRDFIAIAEETGVIVPLGRWVLETACTEARELQQAFPHRPPLQISINVSPRQLREPDFAKVVEEVASSVGLSPRNIILEITESLLLEDRGEVIEQLEALKRLGVRVAIDDFGTGYSAFSHLRLIPVDILKIDRSFVSGIDRDPHKATLTQGIVNFGHSLSMDVIAEGIETFEQVERLLAMRLPLGQGFFFSRPLPIAALHARLASEPVAA